MFSPIFSYFTIALLVRHLSPTARGVRVRPLRPLPHAHAESANGCFLPIFTYVNCQFLPRKMLYTSKESLYKLSFIYEIKLEAFVMKKLKKK